jgi:hypothetical protein
MMLPVASMTMKAAALTRGLNATIKAFLPDATLGHQVLHYITKNMETPGGCSKYTYNAFMGFIDSELQRQKGMIDAGNKRKHKLAKKYAGKHANSQNDPKMTEGTRRRIELNAKHYTRPHGRLSSFGGVLSREAMPAKANVEENPFVDFLDPESLTTLKTESASLDAIT